MITSKRQRLVQATVKVGKNLVVATVATVATGFLAKKSKEAVVEIGDGAKQIYNVVANSIQRW